VLGVLGVVLGVLGVVLGVLAGTATGGVLSLLLTDGWLLEERARSCVLWRGWR
jgi:hypothetical protein